MPAPRNSRPRRTPEVLATSTASDVVRPDEEETEVESTEVEDEEVLDTKDDSDSDDDSDNDSDDDGDSDDDESDSDTVSPSDTRRTPEVLAISTASDVVHTHVRVRAANSKLRGFSLRGRPLTAEGFTVALIDLPDGELEQFRSEPCAVVTLFTPED